MFRRLGKGLVVAMLVLTTGAHCVVLQTVAWTAMLAKNLYTRPAAEAVQCTFDGRHPCCLCKMIAAGKKSGPKNSATVSALKFEFPPLPERWALVGPTQFELLPRAGQAFAESLAFPPPTPPPRSFCA